jgi:hypothetical protein
MKVARLIFGIFAVVGVGLLIGALFAYEHMHRFLQTAVSTPGVVVENIWQEDRSSNNGPSWTAYPRVRFRTADDREISIVTRTGSNPPAYHVEDAVTILYDPQQPNRASIKSFAELWLLPTILGGMGFIFSSMGAVAVIWKGVSDRKDAWLQQNGRRIQAEFTRVELNNSVEVNGAHPYHIVCQWLDPTSNQLHIFKSHNIWFDPTGFIPGKTIEVWMDPNKPHRYVVATSFLPKVV